VAGRGEVLKKRGLPPKCVWRRTAARNIPWTSRFPKNGKAKVRWKSPAQHDTTKKKRKTHGWAKSGLRRGFYRDGEVTFSPSRARTRQRFGQPQTKRRRYSGVTGDSSVCTDPKTAIQKKKVNR